MDQAIQIGVWPPQIKMLAIFLGNGVSAYRDAKAEAGIGRMTSFHHLYRLEADTVIGILKEKLNN